MSRSTLVALTLAWVALAPSPARAEEGELTWSAGLGNLLTIEPLDDATVTRYAPLLHGSFRYAFTDFWQFGGALRGGVSVGGGRRIEAVGQAFAELRLLIDALEWVPFIAAGTGVLFRSDGPKAYIAAGEGPQLDFTVHLGGGVDYRPQRDWSVGLVVRYHFALTDLPNTTGPIDITAVVSFYSD